MGCRTVKTFTQMKTSIHKIPSAVRIVLLLLTAFVLSAEAKAQTAEAQGDSVFKGYYYNNVYQVYLRLDLYGESIVVEGQEIFGALPGYLGAKRDSRKWLITGTEALDRSKATIAITNDYGSEDLTATLWAEADGQLTLKQEEGSRIKIVVDRKWVKLPTELKFEKMAEKQPLE